MQEFEDKHYFSGIETCGFLVELVCSSKVGEDLAARAVIKLTVCVSTSYTSRWGSLGSYKHVEIVMVGESGYEGGDKGMAGHRAESGPFITDMVDLLQTNDYKKSRLQYMLQRSFTILGRVVAYCPPCEGS